MPVKTNDATINRPEGSRLIDAPAVLIDIKAYTEQLMDETAWDKSDRNAITVFKTKGMAIVLTALHKGAAMDNLVVEGILTLQVIEGEISIDGSNETIKLKKKQMIVLHPDSNQNVKAEEKTVLLLSNIMVAQ
jgi:hypothetical protein